MLHNLKHKNSKTMGREAVRWQILTIAFLSLLIGVFCFAGSAAALPYNLSITSSNGTVTSNPGGINCGGVCSHDFEEAVSITLTATLDAGWEFVNWTGDTTGFSDTTSPTATFIMGASARSVIANYSQIEYTLTINTAGNGAGTVNKAPDQATYHYGDNVILTANPATSSDFTSWSGDLTGSANPDTITIDGNNSVTATFTLKTVTLNVVDGGGTGAGAPNPAIGTTSHTWGDVVNLVANPDISSDFQWSGAVSPPVNTDTTIAMNGDQSVTITYTLKTVTLTVVNGGGTGTGAPNPAIGTTSHTWGDDVNLVANPDISSDFQWTGDVSPPVNTDTTITMNGDQSVTITYTLKTVTLTVIDGGGTGTGIPSPAIGTTTFIWGGVVNLAANADTSSDFQWSGDVSPPANTDTTITMNGDKSVTVTYTLVTFIITPSSGANGTISPNTAQTVIRGDSQTFTFTPDSGFVVDVITIDGGIDYLTDVNEYTFNNVTADHTIDVSFRAPYTVQVNISPVEAQGEGRWRLINNTGGHDFGQPITGWQTHGTTVDVPGNIPNVTIELLDVTCWIPPASHDVDLAANNNYVYDAPNYVLKSFTLTLAKTGNGMVTTDDGNIVAPGSHTYTCGPDVAITANPDEGWVFDHWNGDVAEPLLLQTTVAINGDKTVEAVFVTNTFTLHVAKSGEGTVTPSAGTHIYSEGEIVNLSAVPATDWAFNYWTGDVADPNNPNTTVTMDEEKTVTAFFITTVDPDVDADGDTYTPNEGDCNDNDATIHPNATEICGDGIDQDCNGFDTSCDVDNDGDGYLSSIDPFDPSYDCDDNDRNIHPGATEICDDGIDQDCDGSDLACTGNDLDGDGDGYTVNMGDCNDSNAAIHPGAVEICGDGVDNDCYDGDRACQAAEVKCVDISDTPLDTQVSAAPANIMFVLDDSGSMDWEFTTPSGVYRGYYYIFDEAGNDNNYADRYILPPDERRRWESQWPGLNKMYYDPASIYTPWPNHSGTDNLPDADTDTPRSNPVSASPTLDFNAEPYLSLYENNCVKVTVTRENDGGSTCADAVRFRRVSDGTMFIIDNSGVGFETSGNWGRSSGRNGYEPFTPGFNGSSGYSVYSSSNGSVAAWKPTLPGNGNYEVYACWTRSGTRASNAPYRIYNDGNNPGSVITVTVDQNSNSGVGQWYSLGIHNFTNVASTVTRDIPRAHYYRWHDADGDTNVDDGEIYLIELTGGNINYYRFDDNVDNNNRLEYGELTDVTGSQPPEIVPKNEDLTDRTYAQERQNFVNWYSFYRKREYTAKSAVGRVIDDMSGVNIGIKCINNDVVQTVLPVKVDQGGPLLDDSDTLLTLLYSINSSGGTPLRRGLEAVGRYFDADDGQTGGLGSTPYVSSASGECQQAFAIVMTDGYYNGGDPLGVIGDADGDNNTAFDGGCFADTNSNTLADVAMHYYERDLSTSLNDLVPVGGNDTARHQHMVTYTISFGVFGTIDPADWPNCPNTCPNPWPGTGTNQGRIDDMYHAAVNGRGEYLSAENPQALVDALKALQEAIEERIGSGASVSINSQQLSTTSVLFQGRYDTNTWSGDIRAYDLDPDTGELAATYKWSTHERLEREPEANWNTGREIITYDGTIGIKFRSAEINTAGMLSLLDVDTAAGGKAEAIVDFIRGDDSNEQDQGGTYSFRARGSKLGDIVHSSPILAGNVLYVGSNNGMLHAFDVDTGDEIFAYVPRLVFETLNKLTVENPNYAHTYYIDQSPYIANVGGSSLLVNTLGKGGKGVYCLDVTDITSAEIRANSILKWEYPDSTNPDDCAAQDPDMGYGFSRAFIVDSYTGVGPVVIFSNGYDSASEKAVLYVLDPADGTVLKKIDTGAGSPDPGDCNGLSTPILIDIDLDQKVDFAYAGDLLGNMWKFDLRDSDVNNWCVAYEGGVPSEPQPLFQAKNALGHRQPITMKPDVMRHCIANRAGYMVLFGTGRYLGNSDFADNSVQTLYGIWDWQDAWGSGLDKNLGSFTPTRTLSNLDGNGAMPANAQNVTLLEQTQIFFGSEFGEQFRVISDNMPVWYMPGSDADFAGITSHAGWYFDLPANSERSFKDVLIYPSVYGAVNIAISSIPSDSPCSAGGDSILHAMSACTGARLDKPFFDANGDGTIDSDDLINIGSAENPIWASPTGWYKSGMYYPPAILSLEDGTSMLYFGTSDATVDPTRAAGQPLGLTNWREIE